MVMDRGSLACCNPGGRRELDTTEGLNGLTERSRTTRCKRASSRQTRAQRVQRQQVSPRDQREGIVSPRCALIEKANTRPFCVFRNLAEAAPARDKGFGPPNGWSSLTGRGGKASSWSFHSSASPRGPRAELQWPPSSHWSGGRRRAVGAGNVVAGVFAEFGMAQRVCRTVISRRAFHAHTSGSPACQASVPRGCTGKESPTPTPFHVWDTWWTAAMQV